MKTCSWVRKFMVDRIEGELPEHEAKVFDEHLKGCSACRNDYNLLCKMYRNLQNDDIPLPDDEYWERAKQRIRQQEIHLAESRPWFWRLIPVAIPAVAICVLIIFFINKPPRTVEMDIPISELLEDRDIAESTLSGMNYDDLVDDFAVIEESLQLDIDESILAMSQEEKELFVELLIKSSGAGI